MPASIIYTSWGYISVTWDEKGITNLSLPQGASGIHIGRVDKPEGISSRLQLELDEYFSGKRQVFDLPINLPAGPAFFLRAWQVLSQIRYGQVISYKELARLAGSAQAVRAAGAAMRNNPLPLLVPCHRVIAADGSMGGFSGQKQGESLQLKKRLLLLEGHRFDSRDRII